MCGIAAILDRSDRWVEQPELLRMTDSMRHRGPDDEGWYAGHGVGLGNRRLAIIDLTAGGHQPMSNEDGSIWITYNGMLYNYRELRVELVAAGHHFRSTSDTEVIVHAYEEWGDDCLLRFDGMFAFAIWDGREKTVFLARDPFGIRRQLQGAVRILMDLPELTGVDKEIGLEPLFERTGELAPRTDLPGSDINYPSGFIVERVRYALERIGIEHREVCAFAGRYMAGVEAADFGGIAR